jgi:uncharacterized membrane protein YqjE
VIEKLDIIVNWISKTSGFSALSVKWMGIALLLVFLLWVIRKPWKVVQMVIVLAIFGSLAYVAFDLAKIGSTRQKKILENSLEEFKVIQE